MSDKTKQGNSHPACPCERPWMDRKATRPTRRTMLEILLGLGTASTLYASLDSTAWQAYEAVEEAWIRDRHELLLQHAPIAIGAARIDLDLKLTDLQRRAIQFRHILNTEPALLRGGVWQMTALPVSEQDHNAMLGAAPDYRKHCDRIKQLTEALRRHPHYETLKRAQVRLWKTPQYREVHRRYMGRMQELQRLYGTGTTSGGDVAIAGASQ